MTLHFIDFTIDFFNTLLLVTFIVLLVSYFHCSVG